jgi:hypothetical protein
MRKIQKLFLSLRSLPFSKIGAFIALYLLSALPLFAQTGIPGGMETLADAIMGVFKSRFITVILAIFFCGAAIAFAYNKDNDKVKRNCIAICISTFIIVCAQQIVDFIYSSSNG